MIACSDRMAAALRTSHDRIITIEVYLAGVHQARVAPQFIHWWTDGTITVDSSSTSRRTMNLSVSDVSLANVLLPLQTELHVFYGVQFADGVVETIPVGVFVVIDQAVGMTPTDAPLTLTCDDRWAYITAARFETSVTTVPTDVLIHDYVMTLAKQAMPPWLNNRVTFASTSRDSSKTSLPVITVTDHNRSNLIGTMAASIGAEVYFDNVGNLRVQDIPFQHAPDYSITQGQVGNFMSGVASISVANTFNVIVAQQYWGNGNPIPGQLYTVTDHDPNSPTNIYKIGRVPRFFGSVYFTGPEQAFNAANAMLAATRGFHRTFALNTLVDPRLEPGDTVSISTTTRSVENRPVSFAETHVLDTVVIPFAVGGQMAVTTRLWSNASGLPDEGTITGVYGDGTTGPPDEPLGGFVAAIPSGQQSLT